MIYTTGYCRIANIICPNAGGSFCCETGDDREAPRELPEPEEPVIREPDEAA